VSKDTLDFLAPVPWDDDENMEPDPEMSDRPDWDDQFTETEDERNERLRAKRQLRYDKERRTIMSPDPRDPDYTRVGMFVLHNCSRCKDGREPCIAGNPHQCEYPHARND